MYLAGSDFWNQGEVLPKTLYLYQVCKQRNTTTTTTSTTTNTQGHQWVPGGGPRENPMSLSSPKSEK